ncbi:MAG: ribonuclease III [Gaiellales bacterium]
MGLLELIEALPKPLQEQAFTHASWAVGRESSYERLEFLGDSVLGLAIAREIYDRFPDFPEGRLAKIRAHVVNRQSCAEVGAVLGLGARLATRGASLPPEEIARLSQNRNVLAALLEAALGAVYLHHGFETIRPATVDAFATQIDYALNEYVDYKTELQEELARLGRQVQYAVIDTEGPPHDRRFTCAAVVDDVEQGRGTGSSKKAAEQIAARQALARLAPPPSTVSPGAQ